MTRGRFASSGGGARVGDLSGIGYPKLSSACLGPVGLPRYRVILDRDAVLDSERRWGEARFSTIQQGGRRNPAILPSSPFTREEATVLSSKPPRLIFLDLLRALAVLMMVQGHTVDVLLANAYRQDSSYFYHLWLYVRGMTAPIFLVTTGTVFVYLLRSTGQPLSGNPRWRKGVRRALLLFLLGYLLHFPIGSPREALLLPPERWVGFWAVDVLQLIGSGLLLLLLGAWIAERARLREEVVYGAAALFFFFAVIVTEYVGWSRWLPPGLAAYLSSRTGSLFPLFPWAGYIMAGGLLARYLGRNFPSITSLAEARRLGVRLALLGGTMVSLFFVTRRIKEFGVGSEEFWFVNPDLFLLRLGSVLVLISALVLVSVWVRTVPPLLLIIGRRTLLIYVVHLVMLYGSAWSPGLDRLCSRCLGIGSSILSALLMISGMILLAILYTRVETHPRWSGSTVRGWSGRLSSWLSSRSSKGSSRL